MKDIDLNELKKIQINVLDAFVEFCEKRNLTYFLAYGTLLGAVRHKGYIPWDDDIDVMMPREDYNVLLKTFNMSGERYRVIHYSIDNAFPMPYAKVYDTNTIFEEGVRTKFHLGVNIDVFPLDYVSDNIKECRKQMSYTLFMRKLQVLKNIKILKKRRFFKNLFIFINRPILFFVSNKLLNRFINLNAMRFFKNQSNLIANCVDPSNKDEIFYSEYFDSSDSLIFEGSYYNVPSKYNEVLTKMYGDYMRLPPMEQQKTHHLFKAFWK